MVLIGACALSACSRGLLAPDFSGQLCHFAVVEKFAVDPLREAQGAHPIDAAIGGAIGTLPYSIMVPPLMPLGALFAIPLAAFFDAGTGIECVAAVNRHPNAEAEFEQALAAVSVGSLTRAMEKALNAPRDRCALAPDGSAAPAPDVIVEVTGIGATMTCIFGKRKYWIDVKWRATLPNGQPLFRQTTTSCVQTSHLDVGEWAADRNRARQEVENVLVRTGQHMAVELLSPERPFDCVFRSTQSGEIEEVKPAR